MGIYDRDYGRDSYGDQPGVHLRAPESLTVKIIIFTVVVWVVQKMFDPQFTELFALNIGWYQQPWRVFELLTYGFLHSTLDLRHLLFNMLVLWFFGRIIEQRYGKQEFLAFYLAALVFSGVCWNVATLLEIGPNFPGLGPQAVGASGALSAIVILFAFNYPNATVLLFFVIPVRAWMAGLLWVGMDIFGALRNAQNDNVGYAAHLGGFLFAVLYYKSGWRITDWAPANLKMPSLKRKPPLRVHDPTEGDGLDPLEADVDRILKKIGEQGQDSLTSKERKTLERASRTYQQKPR